MRSPGPSARSSPSGPDEGLAADLEALEREHPEAQVSAALAPVGTSGGVDVLGDAATLVAWSTIKVPLSLAVTRSTSGAAAGPDIEAALTASDNAAAARLWDNLGAGEEAALAVESQLRRGGDDRTRVPPQVTVPGYSPFGQAAWGLSDQARFTAALPCLSGSAPITEAMGRVVDGQRWGLGTIDGARFKGGWGPTPGGYVVRQMGLLPGTKGGTAVAVQARTGTHEQGTAVLTEVARVLREHSADLPTGSCG